jgi:hypothetical protein
MLLPDTIRVTEGDSLDIEAVGVNLQSSAGFRDVLFHIEDETGQLQVLAADSVIPGTDTDTVTYRATMNRVLHNSAVSARHGSMVSDTVRLVVMHRPRIAQLDVRVVPPAYTGQPSRSLRTGAGDVLALAGSRVEVRLETSRPVMSVKIVRETDAGAVSHRPMRVERGRARGAFTLTEPGTWWVEMVAEDGVAGDDPVRWSLSLLPDRSPTLNAQLPEPDDLIPEQLAVPLWADAYDDFGISRVRLRYRLVSSMLSPDSVGEEEYTAVNLSVELAGENRWEVRSLWSLADLPLLPTDEIHWFYEAFDNDDVNGPNRVRTETRRLMFPSVEELLTRSDQQESDTEKELERALDRARRLEEKLRETLTEARSNPDEISWDEARQLQQSLEKQQEAMNELEQVREHVRQLEELAREHGTLSNEVLEKYAEMQEVLADIVTPELRDAMQKLQQSLEDVNGERVREALEQMLTDQEKLRENLERSLSVLRQLREERRLDELATLAESIAKRQSELSDALNTAQPGDIPRHAREQQLISEQLGSLRRRMAETAADSSLLHADVKDSLNNIDRNIESSNLSETLLKSRKALEEGSPRSAKPSADSGAEKLQQLASDIRELQQEVSQRGLDDVKSRIDAIVEGLLLLSEQQQALADRAQMMGIAHPRYRTLAADQRALMDAVVTLREDVAELRKRTFFVGATLDVQLGLAGESMQRAINRTSDRNTREASGEQRDALRMIHRALLSLLNTQQQMQQAQSGTGYEEMMQKLQEMAERQQQINQGTGQMPMPVPGGSEGQSLLSEMAARQRALAEQMQRMNPRGEGAREILGDLEGVGRAMEEVAKDLEDRTVTERTRRLQRRILQKLLESQRSLAQQDRSRERTGRVADDIFGRDPGEYSGDRESALRRALRDALDSGIDERYNDIIRAYFQSLQQEETTLP